MRLAAYATILLALMAQGALAEATFTAEPKIIPNEKAIFATVESANIVLARPHWRHPGQTRRSAGR